MEVGLQIFESKEFGEFRTLGDWENPKFCLVDICRVLDDLRVDGVVARLKGDPNTAGGISLHPIIDSLGRTQLVNFVDEPCLYRIIFTSRKPNAVKFQNWIFHEVIPSLRKTGSYSMSEEKLMPKCMPVTVEEIQILRSELKSLSSQACRVAKKLIKISVKFEEAMNLSTQDLPGEIWYDVVDFDGMYQVSNKKRVRSFHFGRVRIMKQTVDKDGYHRVQLSKNGEHHLHSIHRLLAESVIPNLQNLPVVHHRDDNRSNNCVENLEWATKSDNAKYAVAAGKIKLGMERFNSKLTDDDVRYIRAHYIPYHPEFSLGALAAKFKVSVSTIRDVVLRKTWKHVV